MCSLWQDRWTWQCKLPETGIIFKKPKLMEFIPPNHVRLVIGCDLILCIDFVLGSFTPES